MIIPIRCPTCGKPVGHLYETYCKEVNAGRNPKNTLDKLGVERYCCRTLFVAHVDLIQKIGKYVK